MLMFYTNLLNELRKSNKTQGLPSILLPFHNMLNKSNNSRAQKVDSFFQITLRLCSCLEISFLM